MPWTPKDAPSTCKSEAQKKKWAETANAILEKELAAKTPEKEAAAKAKRIANSQVHESTDPMRERLQEHCTNDGVKLRVDRDKSVIYGVKILGTQSRNPGKRHFSYPPATHAKSVGIFEGVVSNVDHHEGAVSYRDRIGVFRNPRATENGTFGDYHVNPKHALAEQLFWDAEHAPEAVGFSILAEGAINRENPTHPVVEAITSVKSVDLVANPATTHGLYESTDVPEEQREFCEHGLSAISDARTIMLGADPIDVKKSRLLEVLSQWQTELGAAKPVKESQVEYADLTVANLKEHRADLVAVLTGTDEASKLAAENKQLKEAAEKSAKDLKEARDTLAASEAEKAKQAKRIAIAEELKAAKLDTSNKTIVSDAFMGTLESAADAAARKVLIEDRVACTKQTRELDSAPPFAKVGTAPNDGIGPGTTAKETLARL